LNPIRSRRGIPRFNLFGKCSKALFHRWFLGARTILVLIVLLSLESN
jgi:hypothetical protein